MPVPAQNQQSYHHWQQPLQSNGTQESEGEGDGDGKSHSGRGGGISYAENVVDAVYIFFPEQGKILKSAPHFQCCP